PAGPLEPCPPGAKREFPPVLDIHLGVISSSLGGHGADSCPNVDTVSNECAAGTNTTNNDAGHLLSRRDPCSSTAVPTYANKGFLAWDPRQTNNPPGETQLDDGMNSGIIPSLRDMVLGVGQIGCGYESQLESIYRFLADPNPYESIVVDNYKAIPMGTDTALLEERKAFLRPDSLLAVLMLTDENDCSIKEFGQFYYVGQLRNGASPVRLPRARQECAKDPNDPCCKSCGQPAGVCPPDPTCTDPNGGPGPALLSDSEDHVNLRCWEQKRRFGIDFLYPTDRYVVALTSNFIPDREGNVVPNPIFSDLDPTDGTSNIRDTGLVFLAGIVGVPWQAIARDPTDLKKGFKDSSELQSASPGMFNTWDLILGDPARGIKPLDHHMIESVEKRPGLADASTPLADPIHGHEWTIPNDDLQYACIFPLLPGSERDCTDMSLSSCDCRAAANDNPLCAPDPNLGNAETLQVRAKAYPSLRPLEVLRDMGMQGVVASVCPAQLFDPSESAADFGYRAAVDAIRDRLKPAIAGQCMSRKLTASSNGEVPCVIVEGRRAMPNCDCDSRPGRKSIVQGTAAEAVAQAAQNDPITIQAKLNCFCEMTQAAGDELVACQQDSSELPQVNGKNANGWCYVDASVDPPVGNPEILLACPENEKRNIRFLGESANQFGSTLFITCQAEATTCN
ncbi:MAG TPA: hypothetical protein PK156_26025, partial [Polyangium sp.]|nr:hypothetical protein [Polyangium sp.]